MNRIDGLFSDGLNDRSGGFVYGKRDRRHLLNVLAVGGHILAVGKLQNATNNPSIVNTHYRPTKLIRLYGLAYARKGAAKFILVSAKCILADACELAKVHNRKRTIRSYFDYFTRRNFLNKYRIALDPSNVLLKLTLNFFRCICTGTPTLDAR